MAEVQQEVSNAVEWHDYRSSKVGRRVSRGSKERADVVEKKVELAEIAKKEVGPTEAIEAAEQASNAFEQTNEAAK